MDINNIDNQLGTTLTAY